MKTQPVSLKEKMNPYTDRMLQKVSVLIRLAFQHLKQGFSALKVRLVYTGYEQQTSDNKHFPLNYQGCEESSKSPTTLSGKNLSGCAPQQTINGVVFVDLWHDFQVGNSHTTTGKKVATLVEFGSLDLCSSRSKTSSQSSKQEFSKSVERARKKLTNALADLGTQHGNSRLSKLRN